MHFHTMLNHNILRQICLHADSKEIEELSKNPDLKEFIESLLSSEDFWREKMIIDNMSESLAKNADRLLYEKYRTNRQNKSLFYQGKAILEDARSIVKIVEGMYVSTENKIYRIISDSKAFVYRHPCRILALSMDTTNVYLIDETFTIYSLVPKQKTAQQIDTISSKEFCKRIVTIKNTTLRFRSDIIEIRDAQAIISNDYFIC